MTETRHNMPTVEQREKDARMERLARYSRKEGERKAALKAYKDALLAARDLIWRLDNSEMERSLVAAHVFSLPIPKHLTEETPYV